MTDLRCLKKEVIYHGKVDSNVSWKINLKKGRGCGNLLKKDLMMWKSIEKGPYDRPMIQDTVVGLILEPISRMTEGDKKQYVADIKVMNYLLQTIPNDIYNSVDACKNAKGM
ncbi:hypothetical protein Tco_1332954 [Tanacetum coccineum]